MLAPLVEDLFAPQAQRAAPAGTLQVHMRTTPPSAEAVQPPEQTAIAAPAAAPAVPPDNRPAEGAASSRFLSTGNVDQPAAPRGEWVIDTSQLPLGVMYRAQLGIWIDAAGKIQRVEIEELTPDDDRARQALQNLVSTQMLPALLGGLPVGNVRRIELGFGQE